MNDLTGEKYPWEGGPSVHDCGCEWARTGSPPYVSTWYLTEQCQEHRVRGLVA